MAAVIIVCLLVAWTVLVNRLTAKAYIDHYEKLLYSKTSSKKSDTTPTMEAYMLENYGPNVVEWFRYERLRFWAYNDSLNKIFESDRIQMRSKIVKNAANKILNQLNEKNKNYKGIYHVLVPMLETSDGKSITWDYQYIGNEDTLLGKNNPPVNELDTAKIVEDISKLLNNN